MNNSPTNILNDQPALRMQLMQFAMENASIEIYWLGSDARIYYANDHACKTMGYTKDEFLQLTIADLDPNYPISLWQDHWRELKRDKTQTFETTHKRKNGETFSVEVVANYVCFEGHEYNVGFAKDISERKLAEKILDTSIEGIIVTNADRIIVSTNPSISQTTGYSAIELIGRSPDIFNSEKHSENFYDNIWDEVDQKGSWQGEIWEKHKNGETYPKWMSINVIKDDQGKITQYVSTQTDISERISYEKEIHRLGFYDPLTQLPNRRLLMDRLQQALSSSNRSKDYGALLFIDLDNFKSINDTLGHLVGDMQLQFVAERLSSCVREGDTVARIGGDEFVVMLVNLSKYAHDAIVFAENIASKIVNTLSQPYLLDTKECHTTSSIGIALFGINNNEIHELFKQADIALYEAKNNGRNAYRFFDPKMQHSINARASLEDDLRNAIDLQELQLHYQLQFDHLNRPIGAEALIRWKHPIRNIISPASFIPIAEDTGLILPIGQWVLETACAQIKQWEKDEITRQIVLSINVSASQFHENNFVSKLRAVLQRFQINPNLLKLEITESMLLNNIVSTIETMNSIRQFGVQLSLDDFGTGYSSLQYLKQLPLNQLKIDQSFIRDISDDVSDQAIVKTIISMAELLNLDVIAEGVETEAQLDFLIQNGCNAFQGYIYNKPMPIEELQTNLKRIAGKNGTFYPN